MALVVTLLGTATFDTNSGTHTVVATPGVNDLIVIVGGHTGYTGTTTPTDNNGSGTYVLAQHDLKNTNADALQFFVRTALVGSAVSTTFTMAPGTTSGGGLHVFKVTGMTRTGLAAIAHAGGQDNVATGTTPAPVLNGTPAIGNAIISAILNATNTPTTTQRTGYTIRATSGYNTPATGLRTISLDSGETSATITWGSTSGSAYCSGAIELDASAANSATSTLTEDFQAALNGAVWSTSTPAGTTQTVTGGHLEQTASNTVAYADVSGLTFYSLIGSSAYARMLRPLQGAGTTQGHETLLRLFNSAGNTIDWVWESDSATGTLYARIIVNGVQTTVATISAYSQATHAWLRIRESAGTISFDTAPDTASNPPVSGDWVNRGTIASYKFPGLGNLKYNFSTGSWQATGTVPTGAAWWDGLNTAIDTLGLSITDSGSATDTPTISANETITEGAPTYTSWNAGDKGTNCVLSNSNLTALSTTTDGVRAAQGMSSGLWYWEVTIDQWGVTGGSDFSGYFGIALASASVSGSSLVSQAQAITLISTAVISPFNLQVIRLQNDSHTQNLSWSATVGDIIGFTLDFNASTLSVSLNGVDKGVIWPTTAMANPFTIAGNTWYPVFGALNTLSPGAKVTANFGPSLTYTPTNGHAGVFDGGSRAIDTSSTAMTAPLSITDSGTASDTPTAAASLSITDAASATDSEAGGLAISLSLTDAGSASDSESISAAASLTDAGAASDTPSASMSAATSLTDGASASDTPSAAAALSTTAAASANDTPSASMSAAISLTDAASASDTPSAAAALSTTDAASASDTPSASMSAATILTDAAAASDTPSAAAALSTNEAASASDTPSAAMSASKSITDAATATDTPTGAALLTLADAAAASDTPSGAMSATTSLTENAAASDSGSAVATLSQTESAIASDTPSGSLTAAPSITDAATAGDTPAIAAAVSVSDAAAAADTPSGNMSAATTITDAATAVDTPSGAANLALSDAGSAGDDCSGTMTCNVSHSDGAAASDASTVNAGCSIEEDGSASDSCAGDAGAFSLTITESVSAVDSPAISLTATLTVTETASASDVAQALLTALLTAVENAGAFEQLAMQAAVAAIEAAAASDSGTAQAVVTITDAGNASDGATVSLVGGRNTSRLLPLL